MTRTPWFACIAIAKLQRLTFITQNTKYTLKCRQATKCTTHRPIILIAPLAANNLLVVSLIFTRSKIMEMSTFQKF